MKHPFMKFYVRDWQADPELRMCSLEARGYWIECLCIMDSAKRRGFLESPQGLALTEDQRCRLIGTFKDDLYRCESELLSHGVPEVEEGTGVWYCRRMVKETTKAQKCSESGKAGGGNPILKENRIKKIPEARDHISLKATFKGAEDEYISASAALKSEQTFENAIRLIRASHESFAKVPQMHLENSLKDQPDRSKWLPAIQGLAAKYAGAELKTPNRALQNWLAGKHGIEQKPTGRRSTI